MAQLNSIVDSLESKLNMLISAHKALKKDHQLQGDDLSNLVKENQALRLELKQWKEMSEVISLKPALGKSVGYLVAEGKVDKTSYLVLCPHVVGIGDKAMDGDGEIAIPKSWIKNITVLLDDSDVKDEYLTD